MNLQYNFINAEPGTLWEMKKVLENSSGIKIWTNPGKCDDAIESGEIGPDMLGICDHKIFWSDSGPFLKLGETKEFKNLINKFEKILTVSLKTDEIIIGWIEQRQCEFLCPLGEEDK